MSTIAAGQAVGMSREAALEFSFFLSMPTMLVATLFALIKALRPGHAVTAAGAAAEQMFSPGHMTGRQWMVLLIGFVAVWLAFLMIAYVGGDLHSDVLETWTLGRSMEWGYSKHPPLMGWVARAWTLVFPLTNWSFRLMSEFVVSALGSIDFASCLFTK